MEDWYKLRENLVALGNPTVDLDKKILDKGIWTRKLSSKLEEYFNPCLKKKSLYQRLSLIFVIMKF